QRVDRLGVAVAALDAGRPQQSTDDLRLVLVGDDLQDDAVVGIHAAERTGRSDSPRPDDPRQGGAHEDRETPGLVSRPSTMQSPQTVRWAQARAEAVTRRARGWIDERDPGS